MTGGLSARQRHDACQRLYAPMALLASYIRVAGPASPLRSRITRRKLNRLNTLARGRGRPPVGAEALEDHPVVQQLTDVGYYVFRGVAGLWYAKRERPVTSPPVVVRAPTPEELPDALVHEFERRGDLRHETQRSLEQLNGASHARPGARMPILSLV